MLVSTLPRQAHVMENNPEVFSGLVVERGRDGYCCYDPQVKQELVKRSLYAGISVAAMAKLYGVNANLRRKWITHWQSRNAVAEIQAVSEGTPRNASALLAIQVQAGNLNSRPTVLTKTSTASNKPLTDVLRLSIAFNLI